MRFRCAYCRKASDKASGEVNRARAAGLNLYCNRRCSGLGRRTSKTKAQKVADKKAYDAEYRVKNGAMLKAKKREYHQRTYDPMEAAAYRKKRMPLHVEYCRRPEYREWKKDYDRKHRASQYGDFAEAFLLTQDLKLEIKGRTTNAQVKYENGCTNKAQRRKRQGRQEERGRNSRRGGAGNPAAHGW